MDFDEHEVQELEEIEMEAAAASGLGNSGVSSGGRSGGVVGGGVKYKECLKNHAVAIGGHAVDGCCEFMAAGEEGTLDALKCAACNCHRNFHRKEVGGGGFHHQHILPPPPPSSSHHQHRHPSPGVAHFSAYSFRSPAHPMGHLQARTSYEHNNTDIQLLQNKRPLALPSTSRDDEDMSNPSSSGGGGGGGGSKKRFRTKFSQEQKEKMLAFAEKVGWRIQKQDEAAVQQFCAESNVRRHVLKVWMHNNKHTLVLMNW
ncbi:hypothetical protein Leryth_017576 [Lithospermum erythrorhizon]|nr:hypothetical protein Leryth_017576 [Lithospermum erythrorhizon]